MREMLETGSTGGAWASQPNEWRNIPPCHLYWAETANPEFSNNGEKR